MGAGEFIIVLLYLSALVLVVWWMVSVLATLKTIVTLLHDIDKKLERS